MTISSISTRLLGATAAANFGYLEIPAKAKCQHYHLFGGDQASSVQNLVNDAAPLSAVGTSPNATTYEPNCALLGGEHGFEVPAQSPSSDRTCFLVYQLPYTPPPTPLSGPDVGRRQDIAMLGWNGADNNYPAEYLDPSYFFRAGGANGELNSSNSPTEYFSGYSWFYPDGTFRQGSYRMAVTRVSGSIGQLWVQDGTVLNTRGSFPRANPLPGPSKTRIGGYSPFPAGTIMRTAAFAQFTALTDAEIGQVAVFIAADLEARGIDFWAPKPDLAVA